MKLVCTLGIMLSAVLLSACGTIEVGLEEQPVATAAPILTIAGETQETPVSTLPASAPYPAATTTPEIDIIIDEGNITDHLWSSDGTKIAYIKCPEGQFWGNLWIAEWDGLEVTNRQLIYTKADYNHLEDWQGDWILFMIPGF